MVIIHALKSEYQGTTPNTHRVIREYTSIILGLNYTKIVIYLNYEFYIPFEVDLCCCHYLRLQGK